MTKVGDEADSITTWDENHFTEKTSQFIFSKFLGGSMIAAFEKDKTKANEIVKNLILYAGSRSKSSSPHFKAADSSSF